jgi:hypothetical protein
MTPFRQMQSAFDKDCILADKITIIGYSFNDEENCKKIWLFGISEQPLNTVVILIILPLSVRFLTNHLFFV